jgi:hypothetical protein
MDQAILAEIESLDQLKTGALRTKYRELFGEEPRSWNRQFLFRRIAWQLQARSEGDLDERLRQRALAIAEVSDLRIRAPKGFFAEARRAAATQVHTKSRRDPRLPAPGTLITRQYENRRIVVKILNDGFEYQVKLYRSLSAVARDVTGTRWNGLLFFGLAERRNG